MWLFLLSHPKFWILILDFWGKEKVLIFGEKEGFWGLRRERNDRIWCPWFWIFGGRRRFWFLERKRVSEDWGEIEERSYIMPVVFVLLSFRKKNIRIFVLFFKIMLTWKIVGISKISVYIYIYIDNNKLFIQIIQISTIDTHIYKPASLFANYKNCKHNSIELKLINC